MGIIRVNRAHNPYENDLLSWEARGVLSYLLGKPHGWEVRNQDIVNKSPAGRDKVNRILKELRQHGYLHRTRHQDSDGKFYYVSDLYENPADNPHYKGKPQTATRTTKSKPAPLPPNTPPIIGGMSYQMPDDQLPPELAQATQKATETAVAICQVLQWQPLLKQAEAEDLAYTLNRAGYDAAAVRSFGDWWRTVSPFGKKGQRPAAGNLRNDIQTAVAWDQAGRPAPVAKTSTKQTRRQVSAAVSAGANYARMRKQMATD